MVMTDDQKKLVLDNLGLIHLVLRRDLKMHPSDYKMSVNEYEDYYQQGCYALCKAAIGFDPDKGFKFSTYACSFISGIVKRYKRECDCRIKFRDSTGLLYKVIQTSDNLNISLIELLESEQNLKTVFDALGEDYSKIPKIRRFLNIYASRGSLDVELSNDRGDAFSLKDLISDDNHDSEDIEFYELIDYALKDMRSKCVNKTQIRNMNMYEEYIYTLIYGNDKIRQVDLTKKYDLSSQALSSRIIRRMNKQLMKYIDV